MNFITKSWKGILLCLVIAVPCWFLGQTFPIIGGPVFGILAGMIITLLLKDKSMFQDGITFVSKKVLQYAVILLGFGLNLSVILETGKQSLPIIVTTISTSLIIAYLLHKAMHVPGNISTLVGVGSSICGGSAIAATAPVIDADDEEVAQAISVIFFFNMLAALLFPMLGTALGFSQTSGEAFGIFAGTAVNDTSSVTAAASTWDSMYSLGSETLDKAAREGRFDKDSVYDLHLMSAKPFIYVFNVDDAELQNKDMQAKLAASVAPAPAIFLNAQFEADLTELDEADAREMLADAGLEESGLDQLARVGYDTLGLSTFLTAGEKEVRAWQIHKGYTAPQAAGVIHTDFEKGFIKADIVSYDDFVAAEGSMVKIKEEGKLRQEGRDYVMQDGDIVEFKFNVSKK